MQFGEGDARYWRIDCVERVKSPLDAVKLVAYAGALLRAVAARARDTRPLSPNIMQAVQKTTFVRKGR
jgi:hypothetical protein